MPLLSLKSDGSIVYGQNMAELYIRSSVVSVSKLFNASVHGKV